MNEPLTDTVVAASALERAVELLAQADALIVAAGAGMGVDSGLPDFRGTDGFWRAYPALRQAQLDFYRIASPEAFHATPALAWGFYGHRLALYRRTHPHDGFAHLQHWGERLPQGVSVFTSNVDGQFQQAGFAPARIHECHGSIHHLQCLEPCCAAIWPAEDFQPAVDDARCLLLNAPPRCPQCNGLARPNILMFGDWGWLAWRSDAQEKRQAAWLAQVRRPVVIELGAGTAIPSVRHFTQRVLQQHNGRLIRINPEACAVPTAADVGLPLGAAQGLAMIAAAWG